MDTLDIHMGATRPTDRADKMTILDTCYRQLRRVYRGIRRRALVCVLGRRGRRNHISDGKSVCSSAPSMLDAEDEEDLGEEKPQKPRTNSVDDRAPRGGSAPR